MSQDINILGEEIIIEETESAASEESVSAVNDKLEAPIHEDPTSEPGPSTADNQQREVKWGTPSVALNEIELGTEAPPMHERWWSSTAFKSGIAMLAVVGVIGVIVGVAASQAKEDTTNLKKTEIGGSVYNARAMSLFCDGDPPSTNEKCVTSDWNKDDRTEGTRVFYRCETSPTRVIVRTVECDGFTWVDKFNRIEDCPCKDKS